MNNAVNEVSAKLKDIAEKCEFSVKRSEAEEKINDEFIETLKDLDYTYRDKDNDSRIGILFSHFNTLEMAIARNSQHLVFVTECLNSAYDDIKDIKNRLITLEDRREKRHDIEEMNLSLDRAMKNYRVD